MDEETDGRRVNLWWKASGNFVGQSFTRLADGFPSLLEFFEESSDISSRRLVLNERTGKEMAVELAESGPLDCGNARREKGGLLNSRNGKEPWPRSALPLRDGAKLDSFPLAGQVRYKFQI